jgi:hypothetical protein
MERFVLLLGVVLTAAALLAAFPAIVAADQPVPFKGSAELTLTSSNSVNGVLTLEYVGTGHGTHLGRFTETASLVVQADGSFTANVTLTAANGDQVFKTASGTSVSAGDFMIIGGTGRFVNATGKGVVMHASSDGFVHVAQTYDGTIEF